MSKYFDAPQPSASPVQLNRRDALLGGSALALLGFPTQ